MTDRKGRIVIMAFVILALVIPAVGAFASPGAAPAGPAATGELTWELVHTAPSGVYYYSIDFPTKSVGYVAGGPDWNNSNNGRGAPIAISKTIDGGKTWTTTTIKDSNGWARGLACKDQDNCWVAGNNAAVKMLRTVNGGASWTPFSNVSGYSNWLWSAGWTKNGTTILAGTTCYDPNDAGAKANWLRSTDGQTFGGVQAIPGTYMCMVQWDIDCPTPGLCYSAGKQYVWRSNNDGQKWAQTNAGSTRWYGLSCTSGTTCWLSGKSPFIKSTTNSGANWYENPVVGLGSTGHFWDVAMVDDKRGYAAGCSAMTTDNTDRCVGKGVLYRTDDGSTWLPVANVPAAKDFMDLWVTSMEDVYLIDFEGKIWHGTGAPPPTSTPTATATPDTGMISGFAFNDLNGDSQQDENEAGLEGATLLIRQGRTEIATVVSGANGVFEFKGIVPGKYTLESKEAPAGFRRSNFLGTFRIGANQPIEVYLGYEAASAETATPTPTATATMRPLAEATPAYVPLIVR